MICVHSFSSPALMYNHTHREFWGPSGTLTAGVGGR